MINKRLLVKSLLAYNDENTFYDKKVKLNLDTKEGKAKFLKHICALTNSNPNNNSYIVIGIEDETNKIIGVDFFDDSKIQNLVNAYLKNPPKVQYENIAFPRLPRHKVVGLVTINPLIKITSLIKGIWKYPKDSKFIRQGSNSLPVKTIALKNTNVAIVSSIEKNASNHIQLTLDGVFYFINEHQKSLYPTYIVFKEQFVLCWAGLKKQVDGKILYSRVDIELINEQIRLFFSTLDEVEIEYNSQTFIITEYIHIGIDTSSTKDLASIFPLEKTIIHFKDNGSYDIATELLFVPPLYDKTVLQHVYNSSNAILEKLANHSRLNQNEKKSLIQVPKNYMISYFNGIKEAKNKLKALKPYLRTLDDKTAYINLKEVLRVLRKVKYN